MTEESLEIVSREIDIPDYRLEAWRNKEQVGMEETLKAHVVDPTDCKLAGAKQRGCELTMEVELYTSATGGLTTLQYGFSALWSSGTANVLACMCASRTRGVAQRNLMLGQHTPL